MIATWYRGGASSFSPASLFAGGEQGGWYDPSDLSSMFQDTAGTTPAVVDLAVARINDKSGRGNHATQAASSSQPILRTSGGLYWLEVDGLDDQMQSASFSLAATSMMSAAVRITSAGGSICNVYDFTGTGSRQILGGTNAGASGGYRMFAGTSLDSAASARNTSDHVLMGQFAGASSSLELDKTVLASGNAGTNAVSAGVLIGGDTSFAQLMTGRFYGGVLLARALTAGERLSLYTYLGLKAGLSL
jgi:hypothetical protein